MVADQKYSSDSIASEQEVIRHTKKLAQIFRLNEQNAEVYSTLSGENRALKEQLEDYYSQHNTFEKRIKRLERDVKSLEIELEDLDECVDRETVVDLIQEIVSLIIDKKGPKGTVHKDSSYSSESSKDSDSVVKRNEKAVSYKQRRKERPIKVKWLVV